jgi:hypothetical protein
MLFMDLYSIRRVNFLKKKDLIILGYSPKSLVGFTLATTAIYYHTEMQITLKYRQHRWLITTDRPRHSEIINRFIQLSSLLTIKSQS